MRLQPKVPPRLDNVFASQPLYFVTFCTYRRRPLLATDQVHEAFITFAERAQRRCRPLRHHA
jgi:hypothetical protein